MKFALFDNATRAVRQWQDHSQFGYAEAPVDELLQLPDDFEFPIGSWWVVAGELTDVQPVVELPEVPATIPRQVTMRQARLALLSQGVLTAVDTAIEALPSPQREAAQVEWDYAATVDRESPIVALLAPLLTLSEEQIDALFVAAAGL